jgi:hypothetical protein
VKEVDTVITSSELIELLDQNNFESMESLQQTIIYNFFSFIKMILNTNEIIDINSLRKNYTLIEDVDLYLQRNIEFSLMLMKIFLQMVMLRSSLRII